MRTRSATLHPARLWELFDGDRERLNIAHECIDRHAADPHRIAIRIAHADGRDEAISFRTIADESSRCAHWLRRTGHRARRSRRHHAGAVAGVLRGAVRRDEAGRDRSAVVHTVRAGGRAVARRRLLAAAAVDDADKAHSLGTLSPPVIALDEGFAAHCRAIPRASRRPRVPTTWRSSSIPPAQRANCRMRSVTPIVPSSW